VLEWLGREVEVVVDRPLGSVHPSHDDIVYPVNYGFVPGTTGGDGEPVDVYLLGVDVPVPSGRGRVIGVVERRDDVEIKLIAAPPGWGPWTATDLAGAVHFQERWCDAHVHTAEEPHLAVARIRASAKAILLDDADRILLVHYPNLECWGLPGGGLEPGESPLQAVRRELAEEAGAHEVDIGPSRWQRTVRVQIDDATYHAVEHTHVARTRAPLALDRLTPEALVEGIDDVRWWTRDELAATSDVVFPGNLLALLDEPMGPCRHILGT
jgi:inorganic pyrophosphatase